MLALLSTSPRPHSLSRAACPALPLQPLQGCWQLCLEELLAGTNPTAATFLTGGCGALKKALALEPLFLAQYAADPSLYTQDGMQCIWCAGWGWLQCIRRPCLAAARPRC